MALLPQLVIWHRRHLFTKRLVFVVLYMSLASFNFGYDTSIFGSIQGMQSFAREFGQYQKETGLYTLPPYLSSVLNSTPFAGKLIGTLITGPIMRKYGRKISIAIIAFSAIIGVLLQCTAKSSAQYAVGRILCYFGTGVTISVVPTYQSETTPAELRGATVATLQLWIGVGQLLGAIITNATHSRPGRDAWIIPTTIQFIVPALLFAGYSFVPESPRWLLWNDRREEAFRALRYLRPTSFSDEALYVELDLILEADRNQKKGKWGELLLGTNLRRTSIAVGAMAGQQITGQAFVGQYQVVFLQQQGITNPSPFVLNIISTGTGLAASLLVSLIIDTFGRRPILNVGAFLMALWLFVLGGLGSISSEHQLNSDQKNVMIAALMLYSKAYGMSWAPLGYVIMGEVAPNHLREKIVLLASSISVVITFLVSFTLPYLLNAPYANLGAKVGYVYGSLTVGTLIWSFFFVPETKNRSLEELDEMFDLKIDTWKFRSYQSDGIGRKIAAAEEGDFKDV